MLPLPTRSTQKPDILEIAEQVSNIIKDEKDLQEPGFYGTKPSDVLYIPISHTTPQYQGLKIPKSHIYSTPQDQGQRTPQGQGRTKPKQFGYNTLQACSNSAVQGKGYKMPQGVGDKTLLECRNSMLTPVINKPTFQTPQSTRVYREDVGMTSKAKHPMVIHMFSQPNCRTPVVIREDNKEVNATNVIIDEKMSITPAAARKDLRYDDEVENQLTSISDSLTYASNNEHLDPSIHNGYISQIDCRKPLIYNNCKSIELDLTYRQECQTLMQADIQSERDSQINNRIDKQGERDSQFKYRPNSQSDPQIDDEEADNYVAIRRKTLTPRTISEKRNAAPCIYNTKLCKDSSISQYGNIRPPLTTVQQFTNKYPTMAHYGVKVPKSPQFNVRCQTPPQYGSECPTISQIGSNKCTNTPQFKAKCPQTPGFDKRPTHLMESHQNSIGQLSRISHKTCLEIPQIGKTGQKLSSLTTETKFFTPNMQTLQQIEESAKLQKSQEQRSENLKPQKLKFTHNSTSSNEMGIGSRSVVATANNNQPDNDAVVSQKLKPTNNPQMNTRIEAEFNNASNDTDSCDTGLSSLQYSSTKFVAPLHNNLLSPERTMCARNMYVKNMSSTHNSFPDSNSAFLKPENSTVDSKIVSDLENPATINSEDISMFHSENPDLIQHQSPTPEQCQSPAPNSSGVSADIHYSQANPCDSTQEELVLLTQFEAYFSGRLDSEIQTFQENMQSILAEQLIHVKRMVSQSPPLELEDHAQNQTKSLPESVPSRIEVSVSTSTSSVDVEAMSVSSVESIDYRSSRSYRCDRNCMARQMGSEDTPVCICQYVDTEVEKMRDDKTLERLRKSEEEQTTVKFQQEKMVLLVELLSLSCQLSALLSTYKYLT